MENKDSLKKISYTTIDNISKIRRNNPCPFGSGKKYKKFCEGKKSRENTVMIGSPERLRGVYYDYDKMEFMGITLDDRRIPLPVTFSQTDYKVDSGKEKVITRINEKVISGVPDLMRYLSSFFDLVVAADTNTKIILGEKISVTGIVYSVVQSTLDPNEYHVEFPWDGVSVFRNCPEELPAEKFGWLSVMQELSKYPETLARRFALVTDHDLDNHQLYNERKTSIFKDFLMPPNFTLMYGRGDGSTENLLNYLVKLCDKKSTEVLKDIETKGYFQYGDVSRSIGQIPVPRF